MNCILTSIFSLFFALSTFFSIPYQELESAFTQGNAGEIMNLGTTKVLISIDGSEGVYSKSQGTQVLSNFFKNNPPKSFSFSFKGKDSGASTFAMGEYHSNRIYRVSIKFKNINTKHQIESITIIHQK